MENNRDSRVVYPNHVAKTWDTLFNHQKRQGHFLAIIILGGVMTILSALYIMFSEPEGKVLALVYSAGSMGIALVSVALLGLYTLTLNFISLQTALFGSESDMPDSDVGEAVVSPSRSG